MQDQKVHITSHSSARIVCFGRMWPGGSRSSASEMVYPFSTHHHGSLVSNSRWMLQVRGEQEHGISHHGSRYDRMAEPKDCPLQQKSSMRQ